MDATASPENGQASTTALLIDVSEVARRLGISERSVWRLEHAGHLPRSVSVGTKMKRWNAAALAAWIEAGCPAPKARSGGYGRASG